MGELTLDHKAYYWEVVANQQFNEAQDTINSAVADAETDGFLLTLGKRLYALLLFQGARLQYSSAIGSWDAAGEQYKRQLERVREAFSKCEKEIDEIGERISTDIWEFHDSTNLDIASRHLVMCEARRRAEEEPYGYLDCLFRVDPLLSKPETWHDIEFPWVKTEGDRGVEN